MKVIWNIIRLVAATIIAFQFQLLPFWTPPHTAYAATTADVYVTATPLGGLLLPAPTLTLTRIDANTVKADWTYSGNVSYVLIQLHSEDYPALPTGQQEAYYGDGTSANLTWPVDNMDIFASAWGYYSDNATYSSEYGTATIKGVNLLEIANSIDSLVSFLNNAGIMAFLIVAFVLVIVIVKNHIVLNAIGAPVAIVYGLTLAGSEDVYSSLWVAGLAIGLLGFFFLFRIAMTAVSLSKKKGE